MADYVRRGKRTSRGYGSNVVGMQFGKRVVIAQRPPGDRRGRMVRVRCECGRENDVALSGLHRVPSCSACATPRGWSTRPPVSETATLMREARLRAPEVWGKDVGDLGAGLTLTEREQIRIDAAMELLALFGEMALHEIGELFGVSRERVRQIEALALKRMLSRCQLAGLEAPSDRAPTAQDELELWGVGL